MSNHHGKPLTPVKPCGMEVIYLYPCPFCRREIPIIAPTTPTVAQCDGCRKTFPIVPVDEKSVMYIKLMLGHGKAGIDPDYL